MGSVSLVNQMLTKSLVYILGVRVIWKLVIDLETNNYFQHNVRQLIQIHLITKWARLRVSSSQVGALMLVLP